MSGHIEYRRKARKEHYCELCRLPIEAGETYYALQGAYTGESYIYSLHIRCREIVREYLNECHAEYWDAGRIADYILEKCCKSCDMSCRICGVNCPQIIKSFSDKEL